MRGIAKTIVTTGLCLSMVLCSVFSFTSGAYADNNSTQGFTLSPMKENVILNPGETYESSFSIANPATNGKDFDYEIVISPFYVDENYNNIFTTEGGFNEITDWITIDSSLTGTLKPNDTKDIYFTIKTPTNAPAGGQYAAIIVQSAEPTEAVEGSAILERTAIAHTIFAEVTGTTTRQGDILNINVPGFLSSGTISGESTIKNTGNIHGKATYTLKVTPLFSGEEVYTNAEEPVTHDILPNRSYYNKLSWDNTPGIGIFNVVYTVDFEGKTNEISKMVIVCPIWLIVALIIIIAAIIGFIVMKFRKKN